MAIGMVLLSENLATLFASLLTWKVGIFFFGHAFRWTTLRANEVCRYTFALWSARNAENVFQMLIYELFNAANK